MVREEESWEEKKKQFSPMCLEWGVIKIKAASLSFSFISPYIYPFSLSSHSHPFLSENWLLWKFKWLATSHSLCVTWRWLDVWNIGNCQFDSAKDFSAVAATVKQWKLFIWKVCACTCVHMHASQCSEHIAMTCSLWMLFTLLQCPSWFMYES